MSGFDMETLQWLYCIGNNLILNRVWGLIWLSGHLMINMEFEF